MKKFFKQKTVCVSSYFFETLSDIIDFLDMNKIDVGENAVSNGQWQIKYEQRKKKDCSYAPKNGTVAKSVYLYNTELEHTVAMSKYFKEDGSIDDESFAKDFRVEDFIGTNTREQTFISLPE